jgi:ferredoxin
MSAEDLWQSLRAVVDREECFGFGFCVETLPAVFSLDEEGKSVALEVDADQGLLAQAADACPRGAITLVPRRDGQPTARDDTAEA